MWQNSIMPKDITYNPLIQSCDTNYWDKSLITILVAFLSYRLVNFNNVLRKLLLRNQKKKSKKIASFIPYPAI